MARANENWKLKSIKRKSQSSDTSTKKLDISSLIGTIDANPNTSYSQNPNNKQKYKSNETQKISKETNTSKNISNSENICPQTTSINDHKLNIKQSSRSGIKVIYEQPTLHDSHFTDDKLNINKPSNQNIGKNDDLMENVLQEISDTEYELSSNESSKSVSPISDLDFMLEEDTVCKDDKLNTNQKSRSNSPSIVYEHITVPDSSTEDNKSNINRIKKKRKIITSIEDCDKSITQDIPHKEDELSINENNENNSAIEHSMKSVLQDESHKEDELIIIDENKENEEKINNYVESVLENISFKVLELIKNPDNRSISPIIDIAPIIDCSCTEDNNISTDQRSSSTSPVIVYEVVTVGNSSCKDNKSNVNEKKETKQSSLSILGSKQSTSRNKSQKEDELNTSQSNQIDSLSLNLESKLEDSSLKNNKLNNNQRNAASSPIEDLVVSTSEVTFSTVDESNINESISPILDSTESVISNGSPTEVESSSTLVSTRESSSYDQFYMASESSISDTSISDYLSSHPSNKDTSISDYLSSHSSNKDTSISDDLLSQSSSNEYTSQDESFENVSFINENRATSSCSNTVSKETKKQVIGNNHKSIKNLKQNIAEDYTKSNYKLQVKYLKCFNKKGTSCYTSTSKLSFKTIKKTISNIDKTNLVFIKGPNGCGKSTDVPFYIYTSCLKKNINCNIIITQPTSIAAITIAKKLCEKINCCLGTYVGYHTDFVKCISTDTFITYCTNYILLRKFVKRNVNNYTHIILDDVHVRSKELDILLYLTKIYLMNNSSKGKIMLMSAALNLNKFMNYFLHDNSNISSWVIRFLKKSLTYKNINYLNERSLLGSSKLIQRMMIYCVKLIKAIEDLKVKKNKRKILNKKNGILIFLPKIQEIEQMYDILMSDEYKDQWDIIIFDSSINIYKQEKLLNPELPYKNRRIILTTNIAENAIKIPDIKYVIDFCLTAQLEINQKSKIPQLRNIWASKVICKQRSNRINCNGKGYVYRLVTKKFYTELLYKELNPEIMQCPLEDMFIQMKIYQHSYESNNIFSSLIDPPPLNNVELSQLLLQECGALCSNINKYNINVTQLTDLGHLMGALPLEIHLTKLILLGYFYGLTEDMIIIACCMSVKDIFFTLYDKKQALDIYSEKLHWANGSDSDCIALLNVYKEWIKIQNMSIDFQQKWAKMNFLEIDALNEVSMRITTVKSKLRQFYIGEMNNYNAIKWNDEMVEEVIRKIIIAGAFYPNYYNKCTHLESSYRKPHLTKYFNEKNTVIVENLPVQQPKYFYMNQVDKILKRYLNSHFESILSSSSLSSQIHIHFNNEEEGEIPLNVYKSIQMRKLKIPFEVSCLNEKYPNHDNSLGKNYFDTLSDYFIKNSNMFKDEYAYMNPILPSITVSTFPIDKIDYISPYYFLVQTKDSQINMTKEMMMKSLNEDSNSLTTFNILPNVNDLVAVPLNIKDDTMLYYRGIVKKYDNMWYGTYVTLQLIDIGFTSVEISSNLIRKIKNPYIYKIPALVLECVLAGIQDNPNKNDQDTSSMDFIKEFINMNDTNENLLHGEIYSIVNNVVALTLLLKTKEKTYNINEILLDKNYAIVKEESQLSKENNYVRNNYLHMSEQAIESYNKMQYRDQYSNDSSCAFVKLNSDVKEFNSMNKITLTGPYSLIECNFSALIKGGKLKKAIIDCNSINSVILDNDTNERKQNKDFLLIGGKIMRNTNDNTLMLYNSTVIESTCGLQALIILLFSSHLELRYDLSGTCCIGALCGLGFDNYTGYNIFPEHDMSILFNYEISIKDIKLINDVRKYMNKMTHYPKDINHETIMRRRFMYQNMIQILILKLLKNDRKENKHIFPLNYDRWGLYEEKSKIITRNYPYNVSFNDHIYESHSLNGLNYFK